MLVPLACAAITTHFPRAITGSSSPTLFIYHTPSQGIVRGIAPSPQCAQNVVLGPCSVLMIMPCQDSPLSVPELKPSRDPTEANKENEPNTFWETTKEEGPDRTNSIKTPPRKPPKEATNPAPSTYLKSQRSEWKLPPSKTHPPPPTCRLLVIAPGHIYPCSECTFAPQPSRNQP